PPGRRRLSGASPSRASRDAPSGGDRRGSEAMTEVGPGDPRPLTCSGQEQELGGGADLATKGRALGPHGRRMTRPVSAFTDPDASAATPVAPLVALSSRRGHLALRLGHPPTDPH